MMKTEDYNALTVGAVINFVPGTDVAKAQRFLDELFNRNIIERTTARSYNPEHGYIDAVKVANEKIKELEKRISAADLGWANSQMRDDLDVLVPREMGQ